MTDRIEVYTDGACGWDGRGGWAWWVDDDLWENGPENDTTNQRMEMTAVLKAMEFFADRGVEQPILIVSDSAYVVNCFLDHWYRKWERNGWKNGKNRDVANRDLWVPMLEVYRESDVEFKHVRGHQGNYGNEKADLLAVEAKLSP